MYKLRDGCEYPVHGKINKEDHNHPEYGRYLTYRAAMTEQLVRCPSFQDWLVRESFYDDDYDNENSLESPEGGHLSNLPD